MATNDAATLVVGSGNYYKAPVDTACPVDLTVAPATPWEDLGHTSLTDIMGITSEGGDATVLGTLQNKSLRTTYSARTETFAVILQQFDATSLELFFGSNMVDVGDGTTEPAMKGVPENPVVTESAFLAIFTDGTNHFAIYAPKAEIFRNDDMTLADTESLAGLPIGVKPLKSGTNEWTYAITPLGG